MGRPSILVVEDDADARELLAQLLELSGYRIETAANGREALDHLAVKARETCLILLDLMMPVMNGWEFRKGQLADALISDIPVVVLTADANAAGKARDLEAAGHIGKPFMIDDLLAVVRNFCGTPGS